MIALQFAGPSQNMVLSTILFYGKKIIESRAPQLVTFDLTFCLFWQRSACDSDILLFQAVLLENGTIFPFIFTWSFCLNFETWWTWFNLSTLTEIGQKIKAYFVVNIYFVKVSLQHFTTFTPQFMGKVLTW